MAVPTDFDSFRMGVNLTAANYSGGAGGSFADLVQGAGFWNVVSATPSFETRNGIEGMDFSNDAGQAVIAPMLALHEATIVMIAQSDNVTESGMLGGTYTAGTSWAMFLNSARLFCFAPPSASAATSTNLGVISTATVLACSWSPDNGTLYAQIDDGAVATATGNGKDARINWSEIGIGRVRTTYFSGWVARVLVFDRALHFRDNDGLQSLIAAEMASVA